MKSLTSILLFALILPLQFARAESSLSKEDLELQIALENQYTFKIKQTHPDLRFMVTVHLMEHPKVELDLLGGFTSVRNQNDSILAQVKQVDIVSEEKVDLKTIADIVQLPESKLKSVEIKFPKKFETLKTLEEQPKVPAWAWYLGIALLGAAFAFGLMGLFRIKNSIGSLIDPITKGFQNLSESETRKIETAPTEKEHSFANSNFASQQSYRPMQFKAFFAECYWTHHDAEASALIRAFPEVAVYGELRFGAQYMDYLKNVKPGSLEFMKDPYFLNPAPVFFDLSVADTPLEMVPFVSQFRFEAKNLGALELIKLQENDAVIPDLRGKQSPMRALKQAIRIRFKSVEEEAAVLASNQLSHEVKLKLPSLYRLHTLPQEQFDSVVSELTVNELARSWVGPAQLLAEIEARLPERKRVLLQDVVQKQTPNREGPSFNRIMSLCDAAHEALEMPEQKAA